MNESLIPKEFRFPFLDTVEKYATEFKLDPLFVLAVIITESSGEAFKCKYEPGYIYWYKLPEYEKFMVVDSATAKMLQGTSWSLMQVMGAVLYEYGYNYLPFEICYDVDKSIYYGCMHLARMRERFSLRSNKDIYASYNAGSVRKTTTGEYVNQSAVNNMLKNFVWVSKGK